jgi:hypothetical protein
MVKTSEGDIPFTLTPHINYKHAVGSTSKIHDLWVLEPQKYQSPIYWATRTQILASHNSWNAVENHTA